MNNIYYVSLYLIAIVSANLTAAAFGPKMTVINAFLFIGLDLTSRDKLHDAWQGRGLFWKMTVLILIGSTLSWFLNRNSGIIALASFIAFLCANFADAFTYQLLHKQNDLIKINGSNVVSAGIDSLIFPSIAFGFPLLWGIILGQFIAKVFGGFIWILILRLFKSPVVGKQK